MRDWKQSLLLILLVFSILSTLSGVANLVTGNTPVALGQFSLAVMALAAGSRIRHDRDAR